MVGLTDISCPLHPDPLPKGTIYQGPVPTYELMRQRCQAVGDGSMIQLWNPEDLADFGLTNIPWVERMSTDSFRAVYPYEPDVDNRWGTVTFLADPRIPVGQVLVVGKDEENK